MLTQDQINKMTSEEITEVMLKLSARKSELKAEALEKINKRILELHNEKNLLDKPIYTQADIAKITKVAPSTVRKVISAEQEETNESEPVSNNSTKESK